MPILSHRSAPGHYALVQASRATIRSLWIFICCRYVECWMYFCRVIAATALPSGKTVRHLAARHNFHSLWHSKWNELARPQSLTLVRTRPLMGWCSGNSIWRNLHCCTQGCYFFIAIDSGLGPKHALHRFSIIEPSLFFKRTSPDSQRKTCLGHAIVNGFVVDFTVIQLR